MVNSGYGNFNLNVCRKEVRCPGCGVLGEIRAFGIYKAKLEIYRGFKESDKVWIDSYENYEDHYVSFDCYLNKHKNATEIDFKCSDIKRYYIE